MNVRVESARHRASTSIGPPRGEHKASPLLWTASRAQACIGSTTGRAQGIAPTMDGFAGPGLHWPHHRASTRHRPYYGRLPGPRPASWRKNVSFPSPGNCTLCIIRQQSPYGTSFVTIDIPSGPLAIGRTLPAELTTASMLLRPLPVTSRTTRSSFAILPSASRRSRPA